MSNKFRIEMSDEELLTTLCALNHSKLVKPLSQTLALLTKVKDRLCVSVDVEHGFVIFGFTSQVFKKKKSA
jgi:hypothetical protein